MNMLADSGEIKQIIVITDGRSNTGISPVAAAAKAYETGITVSTIGIINPGTCSEEKDIEEVEEIARAGGGICQYSHIQELGRTIRDLTHKTAQRTIEQIVSRQLRSIIGAEIEFMEPGSRMKIVDFIENYGDSINLKCIILLDTSGSMKDKLDTARKSMVELLENLGERKGSSSIAVITYSGEGTGLCRVICDFTNDKEMLRHKLEGIKAGGGTPTGPAILMAREQMLRYYEVIGSDIYREPEAFKHYV